MAAKNILMRLRNMTTVVGASPERKTLGDNERNRIITCLALALRVKGEVPEQVS
jgi:hypothetical protein